MAKKREKRPALAAPQDLVAAAELVYQIGELERRIEKIELEAADQIEQIKVEAATIIAGLETEIGSQVDALNAFATVNRPGLTFGGKTKSVVVPNGVFGWRKNPDSVKVEDEEAAVTELRAARLGKLFVRTKYSVDKEAILKEPAKIAGLTQVAIVEGREDFYVKPSETELELVKGARKLKRQRG